MKRRLDKVASDKIRISKRGEQETRVGTGKGGITHHKQDSDKQKKVLRQNYHVDTMGESEKRNRGWVRSVITNYRPEKRANTVGADPTTQDTD